MIIDINGYQKIGFLIKIHFEVGQKGIFLH
jgi:hypothetical protein